MQRTTSIYTPLIDEEMPLYTTTPRSTQSTDSPATATRDRSVLPLPHTLSTTLPHDRIHTMQREYDQSIAHSDAITLVPFLPSATVLPMQQQASEQAEESALDIADHASATAGASSATDSQAQADADAQAEDEAASFSADMMSPTGFDLIDSEATTSPDAHISSSSSSSSSCNTSPSTTSTSIIPTLSGVTDCRRISTETMSRLLQGEFVSRSKAQNRGEATSGTASSSVGTEDKKIPNEIHEFVIIDCRYDYEYNGGHISGAININDRSLLSQFFRRRSAISPAPASASSAAAAAASSSSSTPTSSHNLLLIFHCEFSVNRGPKSYKFFRSLDRLRNTGNWPHLSFPEMCVLEGGYKKFWEDYPGWCVVKKGVDSNSQITIPRSMRNVSEEGTAAANATVTPMEMEIEDHSLDGSHNIVSSTSSSSSAAATSSSSSSSTITHSNHLPGGYIQMCAPEYVHQCKLRTKEHRKSWRSCSTTQTLANGLLPTPTQSPNVRGSRKEGRGGGGEGRGKRGEEMEEMELEGDKENATMMLMTTFSSRFTSSPICPSKASSSSYNTVTASLSSMQCSPLSLSKNTSLSTTTNTNTSSLTSSQQRGQKRPYQFSHSPLPSTPIRTMSAPYTESGNKRRGGLFGSCERNSNCSSTNGSAQKMTGSSTCSSAQHQHQNQLHPPSSTQQSRKVGLFAASPMRSMSSGNNGSGLMNMNMLLQTPNQHHSTNHATISASSSAMLFSPLPSFNLFPSPSSTSGGGDILSAMSTPDTPPSSSARQQHRRRSSHIPTSNRRTVPFQMALCMSPEK